MSVSMSSLISHQAVYLAPKFILLCLAAFSYHCGLTAPNPRLSKKELVYKGQPFEKVVRLLAYGSQAMVITCLLYECVVLAALYNPNTYSARVMINICPRRSPSLSSMSEISPSFLCGILIMLSSALLRVWCFKTLGTAFTYEVAFKRSQKLITTGPYRYVRHPSYTGVLFMVIGAATTCFATGSYINECRIMATSARWIIIFWFTMATFTVVSLRKRGTVEDEGLRSIFGQEWELYRKQVPWRFIPFIL